MNAHLPHLSLAAASVALALVAAPAQAQNLLDNPGFETGGFMPEWQPFGQGWRTSGGDDARTGDFGAVNDVLTTDDTNQFRGIQQTIDAQAGLPYTASAYIRSVAQNETAAFIELDFFDAGGTSLGQFQSDQVFTDQDFTLASIGPVIAPAGTESLRIGAIVFKNATISDNDFLIFDDFSVVVPEPASLTFAAVGGLALIRRRRQH